MQVFRSLAEAGNELRGSALAIGNFDGVHKGHRRLFDTARALARAGGGKAAVLTFEPHPGKVFSPELAPPLIATLPRKLQLLEEAGVDATILQPFDREYAMTTAEQFVKEQLVGTLGVADVVVGHDFTFGKGRVGTPSLLSSLAEGRLHVHVVPAVMEDGLVVSSSKIRELVLAGKIAAATRLLGRPPILDGVVVPGRGRGRTIGFPTANLQPETELVPATGVYAVRVAVEGIEGVFAGAANIGVKPTFGEEEQTVEIHVIDQKLEIYGRKLAVAFLERLRGEARFESVEALVEQIGKDVEAARALDAAAPPMLLYPV